MLRRLVAAVLLADLAARASAQNLADAAARERRRREGLRQAGQAHTTPTFSDRPAARAWQPFADPAGEFSVMLPAPPELFRDELDYGTARLVRRRFQARAADVEYLVEVADYPAALTEGPSSAEALFDALQREQALKYVSSVGSRALIGLQGAVGRLFSLACAVPVPVAGKPRAQEESLAEPQVLEEDQPAAADCLAHSARAYLVGRRVFLLTAIGLGQPDERFFDSFRIGKAAGGGH